MSNHQPPPPPSSSSSDHQRHDSRSYEHNRHTWDSRQPPPPPPPTAQQPYQPQQGHFQIQSRPPEARPQPQASDFWNEEGSDSDVSRTLDHEGPVNRILSPVATPRILPPLTHPPESLDQVARRIADLERVDEYNDKKFDKLLFERKRKDDRIRNRREQEDEKIRAVWAARERKDARIHLRRERENAAFKRSEREVEEEGMTLRRRKKDLKRSLPTEDSAPNGNGGKSNASMSPPIPHYGIPPPAKRHQSGPPGQNESPVPPPSRPLQTGPSPQHLHQQPYQFFQPNTAPYNVPYHHPPGAPSSGQHQPGPQPQSQYSQNSYHGHTSANPPSTSGAASSPQLASASREGHVLKVNGFSTLSSAPGPAPLGPPAQISMDTKLPPVSNSSVYDTRPPASSGFTSVNTPQPLGFATINSRAPNYTTTPPSRPKPELKQMGIPTPKSEPSRGPGPARSPTNSTPTSVGGLALNKRTPSTTHPYQMSEAFANRHHHCERVDDLNRGIWTSYGPNGTRDMPTGPSVQMYLRCNHDDCKRIDWRTVHGLQCHIVKNHEQPKGTIGSLEKALDRYGVPVRQIEEYERTHGHGTAGQMADPKNLKIKNKTREMKKNESPITAGQGSFSTPPVGQTSSYSLDAAPLGGPMFPTVAARPLTSGPERVSEDQRQRQESNFQGVNKFQPETKFHTVGTNWASYKPPPITVDKIRGDAETRDAPPLASTPVQRHMDRVSDSTPPTNVTVSTPTPAPLLQAIVGVTEPSQPVSSEKKVASISTSADAPAAPVEGAAARAPIVEPTEEVARLETQRGREEVKEIKAKKATGADVMTQVEEPRASTKAVVEPQRKTTEVEAEQTKNLEAEAEAEAEAENGITEAASSVVAAPATPLRKATRKESISVSKEEEEAKPTHPVNSVMASPSTSKAGRASRRVSVATTINTGGASVDGEESGAEEKGVDAAKGEKEREKAKNLRRGAQGRFTRRTLKG